MKENLSEKNLHPIYFSSGIRELIRKTERLDEEYIMMLANKSTITLHERDRLVFHFLPLVAGLSKRRFEQISTAAGANNQGLDVDELFGFGVAGLFGAAEELNTKCRSRTVGGIVKYFKYSVKNYIQNSMGSFVYANAVRLDSGELDFRPLEFRFREIEETADLVTLLNNLPPMKREFMKILLRGAQEGRRNSDTRKNSGIDDSTFSRYKRTSIEMMRRHLSRENGAV
jgi:hypothetical protein